MTEAVHTLVERCKAYPNFVLSSGCDIPPDAKWENIRAFFTAIENVWLENIFVEMLGES